jgi:hypothetical protein
MKSSAFHSLLVEQGLTREAGRHIRTTFVVLVSVCSVFGQQSGISTTPIPGFGPVVFDASGNQYGANFGKVTAGAAQTTEGGGLCLMSNGFFSALAPCPDAYAGKLDASGNLIWGTLLGGSMADVTRALAIDSSGNVYIAGSTGGSFPTTPNAALATSTTANAFAAKISADGSRVIYATYLPDIMSAITAIAVDSQGNAYVGGASAAQHAVVVKLNAAGSAFSYSRNLAGSYLDSVNALKIDNSGYLLVAGQTNSPDFPVTPGVVQLKLKGLQNAFAARLDPAGNPVFVTYLGGSGTDTAAAINTDAAGNVYLTGQTNSLDFPTTSGAFEPSPFVPLWNNDGPGGFAVRLTPDGTSLAWSTYVMSTTGATQLAVTPAGEVYLAGITGATFPVTASAPQACFDGTQSSVPHNGIPGTNAFVAHLDLHGALLDATYAAPGANQTYGLGIAADGSILLESNSGAGTARSQFRFGGTAAACLSPAVLTIWRMAGRSFPVSLLL